MSKRGIYMNMAVFCSGNGGNFQAIVDAQRRGLFKASIALMVCDNPSAFAIKRAKSEGIPLLILDIKDFSSKEEFERRIIQELEKRNIELVCLAGYMRLLSPVFVARYKGRIVNVHPSLLPAFKGADAINDAFEYGVKRTGVTVHFVTDIVDDGPIILQEAVEIDQNDTKADLEEKIHIVEHKLYPQAIKLFVENNIVLKGRKTRIKGRNL